MLHVLAPSRRIRYSHPVSESTDIGKSIPEAPHPFKGKARLQLDAALKSKFRKRSYRISERTAAAMSSAAGMAFFSRVSLKAMGTFLPATRLMGASR